MSHVRKQFTINEAKFFKCWIYVIRQTNGVEEFWFKGREIAEFLEYKKPYHAINYNLDKEYQKLWLILKHTKSFGTLVTSPKNLVITPLNWQP